MAELLALRAILLNVLFKLANGEKPTAEEMQRLIDRADSDKLKKVRKGWRRRQSRKGSRKRNPENILIVFPVLMPFANSIWRIAAKRYVSWASGQ
jgi:hypothetical protein